LCGASRFLARNNVFRCVVAKTVSSHFGTKVAIFHIRAKAICLNAGTNTPMLPFRAAPDS
jgi:hypothetical protein